MTVSLEISGHQALTDWIAHLEDRIQTLEQSLEAAQKDTARLREWVIHNGGLLNEWAKEWNPRQGTLTDFIGKKLDAAMKG